MLLEAAHDLEKDWEAWRLQHRGVGAVQRCEKLLAVMEHRVAARQMVPRGAREGTQMRGGRAPR